MRVSAILLVTGSELSRGETHDLNGPFLARELTELGVRVERILLVPDDPAILADDLREAIGRADLVISSGGLGPTADDLTVRVAAGVFGRGVIRDPEARRRMEEVVRARYGKGHPIPDNFFKQAEVIEGSEVLLNPAGLAPGMVVTTERGFLAVLPGVPRELEALYHEAVAPRVCARFRLTPPRIFRAKILGVPESWAEARIQGLGLDFERLEYGIAAKPGDLTIKLTAARPEDFPLIDASRELLEREFGDDFVPLPEGLLGRTSEGNKVAIESSHSRVVHEALLASGMTVATAESCTGGLVGEELTRHGGSSAYFLGGIVAYADATKERLLGVPGALLEKHGAVSEPVCEAMAIGALERYGADLAVSTTGIAGPGGGTPEKPVGLVYLGLATKLSHRAPDVVVKRRDFRGSRESVRKQTAVAALEMLRRAARGGGTGT